MSIRRSLGGRWLDLSELYTTGPTLFRRGCSCAFIYSFSVGGILDPYSLSAGLLNTDELNGGGGGGGRE